MIDLNSVRFLFELAMELCSESIQGLKIEYVEIAPLPMINTDLEVDGTYPPVVEAFRQKIRGADAVLFGCPEYNYSVTRKCSLSPCTCWKSSLFKPSNGNSRMCGVEEIMNC